MGIWVREIYVLKRYSYEISVIRSVASRLAVVISDGLMSIAILHTAMASSVVQSSEIYIGIKVSVRHGKNC